MTTVSKAAAGTAARTDWVAEVFSAMRDCGENISIVYGLANGGRHGAPQWFELQHDEFDGIGGLACLLRQHGHPVRRLPELKGDLLTWGRRMRGVLTVLPEVKSRPRQWLRFDASRLAGFHTVEDRVAWRLLSEAETRAVVKAAERAGASVNNYLLYHLDRVVKQSLTPPGTARRWMLPINLRGAVKREPERAPHMAFLGVDVDDGLTPAGVQQRVDGLRAKGYHWGVWTMMQAGRLMGREGMRKDIAKREREQHGWTGIFSNLGAWDVPGAGNWLFCPAISRVYPVGAGCITMNGRMALTMQLHDVLDESIDTTRALLDAWCDAGVPEAVVQDIEDVTAARPAAAMAAA